MCSSRQAPGAHKGAGGEVLVVGGGPYQGAPYIAAMGALRAGADIVRIASPAYIPMPDLIYERLEGDVITNDHLETILRLVGRADVVVCGMGLGRASHDVVLAVAEAAEKAVFDADALARPLPAAKETIYTPHAGEFARMTGAEPPVDLVPRARSVKAAATAGTILLKGPVDVVSDGKRVRFNRTGTPAMTTGGQATSSPVWRGRSSAICRHSRPPVSPHTQTAGPVCGLRKSGGAVCSLQICWTSSHGNSSAVEHPGSQPEYVLFYPPRDRRSPAIYMNESGKQGEGPVFTHIENDRAQMVDISAKTEVPREAVASGRIYLRGETLRAIREGTTVKGNVLATARVAATLAVKDTPRIIPCATPYRLEASPSISRKGTATSRRPPV
ncbi:protein of unknown function [Methanoculleus bourgensis]|uniref:YjeF C-terminal domain-containing protein n=1 Tax=Methanoculleus bourgensis TaxID=83986 RepID=A0A0X3BJD8_9EURY|nr:protein of unknown function [Methanoculleus bourgensis]